MKIINWDLTQKVYEIKTHSGRTIKASANHPFLKLEGWTRLDQLSPGQQLAISVDASDIAWDKIASITDLGEEDTYDATVPGVHNFVANDIVVHNSLEQDADVVMFLFRREYYDKADKPGLAELIVSKNRHGAVGDINLTFRKELAQFANYTPMQMPPAAKSNNKDAFSAFSS